MLANLTTNRPQRLGIALASLLIAGGVAWAQPANAPANGPTGEWLVAKKIAKIKIAECEGKFWGVVSWEAEPGGIDSKNPDPKLQSRPTLGMPILLGMKQTKPNQWDGNIYNSEDGHTYSANISLADPNTLKVQGCWLGFLCGGENWTRAETSDTPPGPRRTSPAPTKAAPTLTKAAPALTKAAPAPTKAAPAPTKRKTTTTKSPATPVDDVCSSVASLARATH